MSTLLESGTSVLLYFAGAQGYPCRRAIEKWEGLADLWWNSVQLGLWLVAPSLQKYTHSGYQSLNLQRRRRLLCALCVQHVVADAKRRFA